MTKFRIIRPALLLLCAWAFALSARAQIAVESFEMDEADQSARITNARNDQNGKKCAIVKVVTSMQLTDCTFDTGITGVINSEQRTGEIWLWLPAGTQRITITHKYLGDLRNYQFGSLLKEATVYILRPKTATVKTVVEEEAAGQFFVARCAVSGALIEIKGYARETFTNGIYSKLLPFGKYQYQVDAPMYQSTVGTFEITAQGKTTQDITLTPNFAKVHLSADGDIYVNEQKKSSGSWTETLTKGIYKIEVRKPSHRTAVQTLTVEAGKDINLSLPAPEPIYGKLQISSNSEAEIFIDGKNTGKRAPDIINNVLIGEHTVTLKSAGYEPAESRITVQEGKIAALNLELVQPAKPKFNDGIEMVYVEGGTFTMGCTSEQSNCDSDESPTHRVTLSDYYIGKYEVTQAQWKAVMGKSLRQIVTENGWNFYGEGDNYPMYDVSWDDAQEFIRKLNQQTGKNYRLPTEAEWEFAARGGNKSKGYKYSGSNNADDVAWYYNNSGSKTHPVGTKAANELGIYDMSGNVWEWCSDWYGNYSVAAQSNPVGPASGSLRVNRGGGWDGGARYVRVSNRNLYTPDTRNFLGFRLACSSK